MSGRETDISLLDVAGKRVQSWYVVYMTSGESRWWNRFLKPGFQHVQLWRSIPYGPRISDTIWLMLDPGAECMVAEAVFRPDPPWTGNPTLTVQRVVAVCTEKRVRNWWFFGPVTCTELAKACLGLNSMWLRTPYQLYKHISARHGVLTPR